MCSAASCSRMNGDIISSLGRWAATVAVADIGPGRARCRGHVDLPTAARAASWLDDALADADLLHRYSFCVAVAGAGAAPVRSGAPDVRLRLVVPVSACGRSDPADIRHIADLAIWDMNVSGRQEHRGVPVRRNPARRTKAGVMCRSAAHAAAAVTVTPEDTGDSSRHRRTARHRCTAGISRPAETLAARLADRKRLRGRQDGPQLAKPARDRHGPSGGCLAG